MSYDTAQTSTYQHHTQVIDTGETDAAFLDRQFRMSVDALVSAGALAPGEFDTLINTPARTADAREQRAARHEAIAARIIAAMQQNRLREEQFNPWSGRRKEHGQPVRARFEQAYVALCTPALSRQRGALTGIVRAYQRRIDEQVDALIAAAAAATTPEELLAVERDTVAAGFLDFENYLHEHPAGWPTFLRSNGRFRGAMRLREFFDQRQVELPMAVPSAPQAAPPGAAPRTTVPPGEPQQRPRVPSRSPSLLQRIVSAMTRVLDIV